MGDCLTVLGYVLLIADILSDSPLKPSDDLSGDLAKIKDAELRALVLRLICKARDTEILVVAVC